MPLRSSPATLVPVTNRSGSTSYRVTVTIKGKQLKFVSSDLEAAESQRMAWESERLRGNNAAKPKCTWLTLEMIKHAEAAFTILDGTGITLVEAVRHIIANPPKKIPAVKFAVGLAKFVAERDGFVSACQLDNLKRRAEMLLAYVGKDVLLTDVTTEAVVDWLTDKKVGKVTWNNYRGDVHTVFEWFMARKWLLENPVTAVQRYGKRMIPRESPDRLDVPTCRALMAYLEQEAPEWCCMFSLALFVGIRPSLRTGEIHKLAEAVARDGVGKYFKDGFLLISAAISKDGRPRTITLPPNLLLWLEKYPPTAASICPGDYDEARPLRDRFEVGHDELRHTGISAHIAKNKSLAATATEFGTSERIIQSHYHRAMSASDADEFYSIVPSAMAAPKPSPRSQPIEAKVVEVVSPDSTPVETESKRENINQTTKLS